MFLDAGIVEVVDTADVVDAENLEDIVKAHIKLHVGRRGHGMNDGDAFA